MHILAAILMFIIGSVIAACDGDFSGLEAIGKVIGFLVLFLVLGWMFTQPAVLIWVIIVVIVIIACLASK